MLLYKYLENICSQYGQRAAMQYENTIITYNTLKNHVDTLYLYIREQGIQSGVNVGLILHNSIDFAEILIALSRNNNNVFLLNPNINQSDMKEMEKKGQIQIFIVESYLENLFDGLSCPYILRKDLINRCVTRIWGDLESDSSASFRLVQCSSGTTGVSKMAQRSIENLSTDSDNIITSLNYHVEDVIHCPVPMCHGYGLTMGLIASLHTGCLLIIDRWFIVQNAYERLSKATIIIGVPEIFNRIVESPEYIKDTTFENFKWIISSGDELSEKTAAKFYHIFNRWINQMYGMMEVSTIAVNLSPDANNYMSVGNLITGLDFKVVDNVLYVKGKTVSEIYLTELGEVSSLDQEGWFKTKDVVEIRNGSLFLVDRCK